MIFAIIATIANLLTQYVSFSLYDDSYSLLIAMAFGTFTGLIVKYILDKKYIFFYRPVSKYDDFGKFIKYTISGVVTTAIFWGTEILFHFLFGGNAIYIGGALGLGIGYLLKYQLDKKFVFQHV